MADICANFAIRTFPLQPQPLPLGLSVAIVAPISCSRVVLTNLDGTNAVALVSDPANITGTSKTLAANGTETIQSSGIVAFGPGQVICYAVSTGPSLGPISATFTK